MEQDRPVAGRQQVGRSVVDGAFRVLQALPDSGSQRQVARLSTVTGLPRPTVHRLLGQLRDAGMVEQWDGRWILSANLVALAQRVEPVPGIRVAAAEPLQILREQTGATVSLVVPTDRAHVALELVPGEDTLPLQVYAGIEMPVTAAAVVALQPTTSTSAQLRPFGGAVDQEDFIAGMTFYAASFDIPGGTRASIQIATSAQRPAERYAAIVHRASAELERKLARQYASKLENY